MPNANIAGQVLAVAAAVALLLSGCSPRNVPDSDPIPPGKAPVDMEVDAALETLLMERYIAPYEYFVEGWEWDFTVPGYVHPYDPDDLDDRQMELPSVTTGFALGVLVRNLPEETRRAYIYNQSEFGTGYTVKLELLRAVEQVYFGAASGWEEDAPYGEDHFPDGRWEDFGWEDRVESEIDHIEVLEDGALRVVVSRTIRDGTRPAVWAAYTLRPYVLEQVPPPLQPLFQPGETAYRILSVQSLPDSISYQEQVVSINSADDLLAMAEEVNNGGPGYLRNTYLLERDLDLTGVELPPIGQYRRSNRHDPNTTGFGAVFDGQGHTLRGLRTHAVIEDGNLPHHIGLFGTIAGSGEVRDLHLEGFDIRLTASVPPLAGESVGMLAGVCNGAVSRCSAVGTAASDYTAGGLIGAAGWGSVIENCSADAQVRGSYSVGVFVGSAHNSRITDCTARGEVRAVAHPDGDTPRSFGGFVGSMVMGEIRDCVSDVFVKTDVVADWVGGFIGYHQGEIVNCRFNAVKTANWEPADVIYPDAPIDLHPMDTPAA